MSTTGVFTRDQMSDPYPDGIEHHYWTMARSQVVADLVRRTGHDRDLVIEVGSGRGAQVAGLRRQGIDCIGVDLAVMDPLPSAAGYAKTGTDVGDLPTDQRMRARTLLLLDVLEHVGDPKEFLAHIRRSLPNLTHVVATGPARQELYSNYDTHYGHKYRLSRKDLATMLSSGGFHPSTDGYFFHSIYPPALTQVTLGIRRSTIIRAPRIIWVHQLVGTILYWEYRILPRWLLGTSCWCIAEA